MLFSSQLFGCIWLWEVWGWPNGEATWWLQMFCFCICAAHQKQQAVPPWILCHLGDTRQQLLTLPGELLEGSFERIWVIFRQSSNAIFSNCNDRSTYCAVVNCYASSRLLIWQFFNPGPPLERHPPSWSVLEQDSKSLESSGRCFVVAVCLTCLYKIR